MSENQPHILYQILKELEYVKIFDYERTSTGMAWITMPVDMLILGMNDHHRDPSASHHLVCDSSQEVLLEPLLAL